MMLDKEKMFDILTQYAANAGLRYKSLAPDELAAFGLATDLELREALWEVLRYLREQNVAFDAEAAMVMLDLNTPEEQPVRVYEKRVRFAKKDWPANPWQNGLYDLVASFEHVTLAARK